jgi:hypothetical protein
MYITDACFGARWMVLRPLQIHYRRKPAPRLASRRSLTISLTISWRYSSENPSSVGVCFFRFGFFAAFPSVSAASSITDSVLFL